MDVDGVGDYSKLAIRQYPARALRETAEGKYWKRFHAPLLAKQFGAVSSIDFCESAPHHLAVTASTRVTLYDGQTRQVRREIQRFSDKAYSGRFRQDGKLLAAGGEDGVVKVVRYGPDRLHLLSGGDDTTVRWWDVAAGQQLARLDGHSDYVRAAACSSAASPDTWATGGYDHICKLWDLRSGSAVAELDHGAPIEDVAFFPTGTMVVTAGGTAICVWDVLAGGRLLKRLSNHQKTVASIVLAGWTGPPAACGPRLLSGALDGHVKVYELDSFRVTHAQKYAAPVLSLGLSPDCSLLAVGMADGTLSIRKHARQQTCPTAAAADSAAAQPRRQSRPLTATSYRYFLRGQSEKAAAGEFVLAQRRRAKLKPYDRLLRKFLYRKALDAALATQRADVVASVLEELSARGGLQTALGGREAESLLPLLSHLCRYIGDTRYCRSLCSVAHAVLDLYSSVVGESPDVDAKLAELLQQVTVELQAQEQLLVLQGCLEPVLAASLRVTSAATPS